MSMPKREWTANQVRRIPEIRHCAPTDRLARKTVRRHALGRFSPNVLALACVGGWILAWMIATTCLFMVLAWAVPSWLGEGSPVPGWVWVAYMLSLPIGCVVSLIQSLRIPFIAWRTRRMLRAELRRRGIPICVSCGYEGGDIAAPNCPECGAAHNQAA